MQPPQRFTKPVGLRLGPDMPTTRGKEVVKSNEITSPSTWNFTQWSPLGSPSDLSGADDVRVLILEDRNGIASEWQALLGIERSGVEL